MTKKDKSWKLENKIGLNDKQLTTKAHDNMCMFVHENIEHILTKLELLKWDFHIMLNQGACDNEGSSFKDGWKCRKLRDDDDYYFPCLYTPVAISKENREKCAIYEIVEQKLKEFKQTVKSPCSEDSYSLNLEWELPIKSGNYVIGFPDFKFKIIRKDILKDTFFHYKIFLNETHGYIEVKPTIPSLGETMRQLKLYKTYMNRYEILILVTDEKKYDKVFETQNIFIFHPYV